jgi:lipoprotein-anchoring transpeptidase ErfK/SrfK
MVFRTAGALTTLLITFEAGGGQALAQYYPATQDYPAKQGYSPHRPTPPVADAEENTSVYDSPALQSRPLPPEQVTNEQLLPPGGGAYLRPQPGYQAPQQGYPHFDRRTTPPQAPLGYDSTAAGTRPYYGPTPAANEQGITRPHFPTEPGRIDSGANESDGDPRTMAAFPPEVRPETGPKKELPAQFRRTLVDYFTKEPAGTIIVDTQNTYLYLVLGNGKALRYGIGVGREGFTWSGVERVSKVAEWPDWNPPEEMIVRQPYLPRFMAGGETNPLGARALYLGKTVYRIHGTNQPSTIGTFVSSGCIRLTNEDVTDLYGRVKVGTRVIVLPGRSPVANIAAATPAAAPTAAPPPGESGPVPPATFGTPAAMAR